MTIDWLHFTPWTALAGGALIGLAAALLWWLTGRIAGISGLVGGLLTRPDDWPLRLAFTAGLIAAPLLWQRFAPLPSMELSVSFAWMLATGLVVGVGVKLGSGCTSGHGVCGLARLSPRSLAATLSFMATGFITVWLLRHVLGG
jgi:uncharacterized membrane protein YedE/YeeE